MTIPGFTLFKTGNPNLYIQNGVGQVVTEIEAIAISQTLAAEGIPPIIDLEPTTDETPAKNTDQQPNKNQLIIFGSIGLVVIIILILILKN